MAGELDGMISQFRSLATLDERTARLSVPLLEAAARKQISAGVAPDGKPWPQRKKGGRALANAAQAMHAESNGNIVTLVVDGPEYWHQAAKPDGALPQRKQIPGKGDAIPPHLQAALTEASAQAFAELTK